MGHRFLKRFLAVLAAGGFSASAFAADLTLLYFDRPPLAYTDGRGYPAGPLIEATNQVMARAGLAYSWEVRPYNRVFHDVVEASRTVCSPGWYRTPERAAKVLFSDILMLDPPSVGVVNDLSAAKATGHASSTLPAMNSLVMIDGMSRGPYLDSLIAGLPAGRVIHRSVTDIPSLLAMVAAHRADMTIITGPEADYYIKAPDPRLRVIHFADLPKGEGRHIICGKQSNAEILARINRAIRNSVAER